MSDETTVVMLPVKTFAELYQDIMVNDKFLAVFPEYRKQILEYREKGCKNCLREFIQALTKNESVYNKLVNNFYYRLSVNPDLTKELAEAEGISPDVKRVALHEFLFQIAQHPEYIEEFPEYKEDLEKYVKEKCHQCASRFITELRKNEAFRKRANKLGFEIHIPKPLQEEVKTDRFKIAFPELTDLIEKYKETNDSQVFHEIVKKLSEPRLAEKYRELYNLSPPVAHEPKRPKPYISIIAKPEEVDEKLNDPNLMMYTPVSIKELSDGRLFILMGANNGRYSQAGIASPIR